ncbi:MAG TPA: zinc-dependent metalloprotease [Flavobacterium sp.]|jgi:hypothetical protein
MKNSKILLIGLFVLGYIIHGNAQNKGQVAKMLNERTQNSTLTVYTNLLNTTTGFNASAIANEVSNATVFNLDRAKALEIINQGRDLISLEIQPNDANVLILDLYRETDAFSELSIRLSDGTPFDMSTLKAAFYRGIIRGNENSVVSLSIFENEVAGIITSEKGNLVLGKLKNNPQMILYNDRNLKDRPEFNCATPDLPLSDAEGVNYQNVFSPSLTLKCVRLAFETEYDIFQTLGSVPNVINYVTNLYNQVGTLYANDGIRTALSNIVVWNTPDPYTAANSLDLLYQYHAQTNSINGDLGQLITFRPVGGGIATGYSGICNGNVDESLCISGNMTSSIVNVPTFSWNVYVVTHEFGHLLGSRHTHACVWNGNNTAIDGCSGFTELGSCPIPGIPANGGTIMSYCHLQPVGVNFLNGFGPQPTAVITSNVNGGVCLNSCFACPADLVVTTNVIAPNADYRQASATITATNTIAGGATGIYHAGTELVFQNGFIAATGSYFRGYIEGCSDSFVLGQNSLSQGPVAVASHNKNIRNTVPARNPQDENTENLVLAPNPNNGSFVLDLKGPTTGSIQITDLNGRIVYERTFKNEAQFEIDIQERPKGIYVVRVLTDKANIIRKIIKN